MNICPICEASLSYHTLYVGNLVPAYTCITYFPVAKKKDYQKKINKKMHVTTLILKKTYMYDQKSETSLGA